MAIKTLRPIRVEGNIAHVPLTKGRHAIIDTVDIPLVEPGTWYALVNRQTAYAVRSVGTRATKRVMLMHRVIVGAPDGMDVDHINGDGLDNRRANLRLATRSENMRNSRQSAANTSGFKGVCWNKRDQNWVAAITVEGRMRYLGAFGTPEAAHEAYLAAATRLFGQFARAS